MHRIFEKSLDLMDRLSKVKETMVNKPTIERFHFLEFLFENPNSSKGTRRTGDLPPIISADDDQQSSKDKFAQIKAKFEKNSLPKVIPSPVKNCADVQYEMIDENGHSLPIDGIEDIIKMSGIEAREFQQADGTIVREYHINDPQILSKVQSQRSEMISQTKNIVQEHSLPPPPPPPRITRRASTTLQPVPSINLQQVHSVKSQQPYEYVTSTGRSIHFIITELDEDQQTFSWNSIYPSPLAIDGLQIPQPFDTPETLMNSQTSNDQSFPTGQFPPIFTEPIIDWSILRQQDPEGQIDSELVRQFIQQRHQLESSQLSSEMKTTQSINSPVKHSSQSNVNYGQVEKRI